MSNSRASPHSRYSYRRIVMQNNCWTNLKQAEESTPEMAAEFIAKDNVCGQNLLQIVAAGNAIIAEVCRLKDHIPEVFQLKPNILKKSKYSDLIHDFGYFEKVDDLEKMFSIDSNLKELDDVFRDKYFEILNRFYLAFEGIYQYAVTLNSFVKDLNNGVYIQQTLETIFQDVEGKQLLVESVYLYGVALLVLDFYIPDLIRERLIISYLRYNMEPSRESANIENVCKLLRSTKSNDKKTSEYPGNFFRRTQLDENLIEMVVGKLRSDDIYNQLSVYPRPEHSSTALANQAAMLYVCLYFSTKLLDKEFAVMRGIVDKFFPDNWIVPIYMGITINLMDSWVAHPAALEALKNTTKPNSIKEIANKHYEKLQNCLQSRNDAMLEENITRILVILREWNVSFRWIMLHTFPSNIQFSNTDYHLEFYKQINGTNFKSNEIVEMLLGISQLENKVRDSVSQLLGAKESKWNLLKNETIERIIELSEVFSGQKSLHKVKKNDSLMKWFVDISKEIEQLCLDNRHVSERKMIQLRKVLEEVEEFHNLDANMQIKQHLMECRQYLEEMITIVKINEDTLINIQLIGDFSYAFINISNYTEIMQKWLIDSPNNSVFPFREVILKLASALEVPLLRINQAQSYDLESVSGYYSNELVKFMRTFVQIIPQYIFDSIIDYFTMETNELPRTLSARKQIASLTLKISSLTDNILSMNTTLVGTVELNPKQLLEDSIRKELGKHLEVVFNGTVVHKSGHMKENELNAALKDVAKSINKYRWSLEYIQDYLHTNGLKIFEEELCRVINKCVRMEYMAILEYPKNEKILRIQKDISLSFIGDFVRKILSSVENSYYNELRNDFKIGSKDDDNLNLKFFTNISKIIGPAFLQGMDKIICHLLVVNLQAFLAMFQKSSTSDAKYKKILEEFKEGTPNVFSPDSKNYYASISKFNDNVASLRCILNVGQLQILRTEIAFQLNKNCRFYAKNYELALRTLNEAILLEIKEHAVDASEPIPNSDMLGQLNTYLECTGLYNPNHKVYVTTTNTHSHSVYFFVFIIQTLDKINNNFSPSAVDEKAFYHGIVSLLRQFHLDVVKLVLQHLAQYIMVHLNVDLRSTSLKKPAKNAVAFYQMLSKTFNIRNDLLPDVIQSQFKYLSQFYSVDV